MDSLGDHRNEPSIPLNGGYIYVSDYWLLMKDRIVYDK
jgi:hypothetical protein